MVPPMVPPLSPTSPAVMLPMTPTPEGTQLGAQWETCWERSNCRFGVGAGAWCSWALLPACQHSCSPPPLPRPPTVPLLVLGLCHLPVLLLLGGCGTPRNGVEICLKSHPSSWGEHWGSHSFPPVQLLQLRSGPRSGCAASERSDCQNRSKTQRRNRRQVVLRAEGQWEEMEGKRQGGREGLVSKADSCSMPAEQISSVYFISLVEPL